MSVNPFLFTQTRDFAATSPVDLTSAGTCVVSSATGSKRIGDDDDNRAPREGGSKGRPREERERDTQRQALAKLILGAFDVIVDAAPADASGVPAAPARTAGPAAAQAAERNPELERTILEFMYALFHALDQIDDSEPLIEIVSRPMGIGPGTARAGRNAFGERLELLARHVAAPPPETQVPVADEIPGLEGVAPRLARSYVDVLQVIHGHRRADKPNSGASPRALLAALLVRLANAMHVAPTLGYGMPSAAGAMLRVRA